MNAKRSLTMIFTCLCLLFLPGCWDYQKINDRAQISGLGVEPVQGSPTLLSYTLQIPTFAEGGSGGSGQSQMNRNTQSGYTSYRNVVVVAKSLNEARGIAQAQYARGLYFGNVHVIIFNTKLSHLQLQRSLDEFMRTPSLEKNSFVLFSDQSPEEVLSAKTDLTPADSIDRILSTSVKQHGYTVRTRLWEFWRDFWTVGRQAYGGKIEAIKSGLEVTGLVIAPRQSPLIDLNQEETFHFNLVAGHISNISQSFQDGDRSFTIGELRSKSSLSVLPRRGGRLTLLVKIYVHGNVFQDEFYGAQSLSYANMQRYEQIIATELEQGVKQTIRMLQEDHVDAFGFGEGIIDRNPRLKPYVHTQWPDDFTNAKPYIQVTVHLRGKGALM